MFIPEENSLTSDVVPFSEMTASDADLYRELLYDYNSLPSPFLTYDFVRACAEARPDVKVARIYDENGLRSYVPFQTARSPYGIAKHATKVAGNLSDCFSPIGPIWPDTLQFADLLKVDSFWFDHLPIEHVRTKGNAAVNIGQRMMINRDPSKYWDDITRKNPKFVQQIKKRYRALREKNGDIHLEVKSLSHEALDHLIVKKRNQYAATNVNDPLTDEWSRNFLHILLDMNSSECEPILSVLTAGNEWVASHLGLLGPNCGHGRVLAFWLGVYNPEMRSYGPGHLLKHALFASSILDSVTIVDLGEGSNAHKMEYCTQEYELLKNLSLATGMRGQISRFEHAIHWRMSSKRLAA